METDEGEDENLLEDIKQKLKDPYMLDIREKKVVGINLAPRGAQLKQIMANLMEQKRFKINPDFQYVSGLSAFSDYIEKMLDYLDEIYYVEKKKEALRDAQGRAPESIPMRTLPSEVDRITLKATECAYAYTGLLFKTVWKPNLNWEVMIAFVIAVTKVVYKSEPNAAISERLVEEAGRLLRTNNFNKTERQGAEKVQEKKMRSMLREALPKMNNIDGIQYMIQLRKQLPNLVRKQRRENLQEAEYRPYNMRPAPLKSKTSNSVLVSCILPNVKDKRIVEHRMRCQSTDKERRAGTRHKMVSMLNRDIDRLMDGPNRSSVASHSTYV